MDEMNAGKQEEPKQPVEKPEEPKVVDAQQGVQETASTVPAEKRETDAGQDKAAEETLTSSEKDASVEQPVKDVEKIDASSEEKPEAEATDAADKAVVAAEESSAKPDAETKGDAEKGKKKPWWKRLLKWLGWTCVVLVVLILLLPTVLSFGVTRNIALNIVNDAIAPAKLEVEDWSFGWFTEQSVEGIHYRDETKGVDAQVKSVRLSSLWKLIPLGQMTVDVEVDSPAVALFTPPPSPPEPLQSPQPVIEAQPASQPQTSAPEAEPFKLPDWAVKAHIVVKNASFKKEGLPEPLVSGVNVEVTMPSLNDAITAVVDGKVLDLAFNTKAETVSANALLAAKQPADFFRTATFDANAPWLNIDLDAKATEADVWPTATVALWTDDVAKAMEVAKDFGVTLPSGATITKGAVTMNANLGGQSGNVEALVASLNLKTTEIVTEQEGRIETLPTVLVDLKDLTVDPAKLLATVVGNLQVDFPGVDIDGHGDLEDGTLQVRVESQEVLDALAPFIGEISTPGPVLLTMDGKAKDGALTFPIKVVANRDELVTATLAAKGIDIEAEQINELTLATLADFFTVADYLNLEQPQIKDGLAKVNLRGNLCDGVFAATTDIQVTDVDVTGPNYRLKEPTLASGSVKFRFAEQCLNVTDLMFDTAAASHLEGSLTYVLGKSTGEAVTADLSGWVSPEHAMRAWLIPADPAKMNVAEGKINLALTARPVALEATVPSVVLAVDSKDFGVTLGEMRTFEVPFDVDLRVDGQGKDLLLRQVTVQSPYVELTAKGSFGMDSGVVAMDGTLTPDFDAIWGLPFLDKANEQGIAMQGRSPRDFSFVLPIKSGVEGILRDGRANAAVAFDRMMVPGLDIPKGEAQVVLKDGKTSVDTVVAMNAGEVRFSPRLEATDSGYVLYIPEGDYLLKDFNVTPELMDAGLGLVSPILKGSAETSGSINVQSRRMRLELGKGDPLRSLDLDVALSTSEITLQPNGVLGRVLEATGKSTDAVSMKPQELEVEVKNGVLSTDKPIEVDLNDEWTVACLGRTDLATREIDYTLSVPLDGVLGDKVADTSTLKPVSLPITGTINDPHIEVGELVDSAAETGVSVGVSRLQQHLDKKRAKAEATGDAKKAAEAELIDKAATSVIGGLFGSDEEDAKGEAKEEVPGEEPEATEAKDAGVLGAALNYGGALLEEKQKEKEAKAAAKAAKPKTAKEQKKEAKKEAQREAIRGGLKALFGD